MTRKWEQTPFKKSLKSLGSSLVLACLSSQVFAAGFQIQEQNASQLGLAYSGTAAIAEDASTGFWNPAGLSKIQKSQMVLSGVVIDGSFKFKQVNNANSNLPLSPALGSEDNAGQTALVPAFHVATRFADKWVIGFDLDVPFGLTTEYDEDSVARYVATKSKVETWNFSPSLAYQLLPCMSIGAGVDALYGKAVLNSNLGNSITAEGFQHNFAEGWAWGFHAGILWDILSTTRVGLSYRSKVNLHLEGDSETLVPQSFIAFGFTPGSFSVRRVQSQVDLPESVILSLYHVFDEKFAATADVHWTNWSRVSNLRLSYSPPSGSALVSDANNTVIGFKDTIRAAAGLLYTYDDRWTLKAGLAWDESPTTDQDRIARLPDQDRWWLAVGAAYNFNKNWRFDFGYAHIFFRNAHVDDSGPTRVDTGAPAAIAANLNADFSANANIVGVQARYDFV